MRVARAGRQLYKVSEFRGMGTFSHFATKVDPSSGHGPRQVKLAQD